MGVWVTWLMFRTSERARLIIDKIKPLSSKTLLFLFTNILKLQWTCHVLPYIYVIYARKARAVEINIISTGTLDSRATVKRKNREDSGNV